MASTEEGLHAPRGDEVLLAGFLVSVLTAAGPAPAANNLAFTTGSCTPESVGVDVSRAITSGELILGLAWGQTFMATDSLIESVLVWRIPQEATNDFSDMKFYLAKVDTTDGDPRKIIIQNGPSISVTVPDASQPTRIQWDFDPPIRLPGPGQYAIWVQVCTGYADFLIDPSQDFTGGHLWESAQSNFSGCVLVGAKPFAEELAFQVIFCRTQLTPTLRETWGSLKLRYR